MGFLKRKNNAKSRITNDPLAAGGTSVTVITGDGSLFPSSGNFRATIWDVDTYADPGDDPNMEIVEVTARSSDTLTISRAKEGTTAVEHATNSMIALLITAAVVDQLVPQKFDLSASVDGNTLAFTLPAEPAEPETTLLIVGAVVEEYGQGFTISGTTLTMTYTPESGTRLWGILWPL